jgi:carbonic anhydrase
VIDAREALARLREGNRRFAADETSRERQGRSRREELRSVQEPFATILGCSDSRVPAEIVFDQGLGDLFVIRVAGNIVAPSQVGSVEFAAARFGTPLVVVLGHSGCGALKAALEGMRRPGPKWKDLRSIVDRVRPAMHDVVEARPDASDEDVIALAIRANIRASVNHLRHASELLEQHIQEGRLAVVGAEYSLETGVVDFFEGAGDGDVPGR